MLEFTIAMWAGWPDSFAPCAGLLGYAPAGLVLDGDEQLESWQAKVLEAEARDEPHGRGGDALAGVASPHPVADVGGPASAADAIQTNPTQERRRADDGLLLDQGDNDPFERDGLLPDERAQALDPKEVPENEENRLRP